MFPRGVIAQRDLEHRRDRQPENSYDYLSYDGEQEQQSLKEIGKYIHIHRFFSFWWAKSRVCNENKNE